MLSIADTGFLVAFAASRDMHHDWAVGVANELSEPALACEAVLAETAFKLRSVEVVLEMIVSELVKVSFDLNDHLPQLDGLSQALCGPATRSGRSLSDPDERALSAPPRDHSRQGFSRLPPEQTRGDSADLPALNPNSPRDESA